MSAGPGAGPARAAPGSPGPSDAGKPFLTVITPTTGKPSLSRLMASIDAQGGGRTFHLLLWDDKRDTAMDPADANDASRFSVVCPDGSGRNGDAPGSILRAVGLTLARTPWVTFADDDVWWEGNYVDELEKRIAQTNWISTHRTIHAPVSGERIGVDRFESVGDAPTRKVPYEMCDGNTIAFKREFGLHAVHLFRETTQYNDDRLVYAFLKRHAGPRTVIPDALINQVCPERLVGFFRSFCDPA
jgi:hypothetical protein